MFQAAAATGLTVLKTYFCTVTNPEKANAFNIKSNPPGKSLKIKIS